MRILLATLLLSALSMSEVYAAPDINRYETGSKAVGKDKITEPSALPCIPQKTRGDKLDDLAKLDGQGESHSTNCPAQGAIKEAPDAVPQKKTE